MNAIFSLVVNVLFYSVFTNIPLEVLKRTNMYRIRVPPNIIQTSLVSQAFFLLQIMLEMVLGFSCFIWLALTYMYNVQLFHV